MTRTPRAAAAACLLLLACSSEARAGFITYDATPYTGSAALATVTFSDGVTPGSVRVVVAVDPSVALADINGFFLNVRDASLLPGLSVSGDVTMTVKRENAVNSAGPGNNVNGGGVGAFDVGLRIGTPGIGGDDIHTATFLLSHPDISLTKEMFAGVANAEGTLFAVRMTSVGAPGSARNGSSKLRDAEVIGHAPEPSTFAGLATLSTLGLVARRLRGRGGV